MSFQEHTSYLGMEDWYEARTGPFNPTCPPAQDVQPSPVRLAPVLVVPLPPARQLSQGGLDLFDAPASSQVIVSSQVTIY